MATPTRNLYRDLAVLLVTLLLAAAGAAASSPEKRSKSPRSQPSSAVFPVKGSVYPDGIYTVLMEIGEPPKPYFLDIDTGSDLTWLQCDAPCVHCFPGPHPLYIPKKSKLVSCSDPLCSFIGSVAAPASKSHRTCNRASSQQCDYEVQYMDQGSSLGVLIKDTFAITLANSSLVHPSLAFGCGYDQQAGTTNAATPTDGVLGLSRGDIGLLSQLKTKGVTRNLVGHCLGRKNNGFLFFGDDLVPYKQMSWLPMTLSTTGFRNQYSPGPANLIFGSQSLGVKLTEIVFDSGSSYTYFASPQYEALLSAVKNDLTQKPLKETSDDPSLPLCWKGKKQFKSVLDVRDLFRPLVLSFVNGKNTFFAVPPENYLTVTKYGNVCLGILNGAEVGLKNLNVIGDIMFQDMMVVYDNEKDKIGWARASCDKFPTIMDMDDGIEKVAYQHFFPDKDVLYGSYHQ